ncbi:esterase/lipase family protein [Pendulispora albinea]|uniref:Triacylglycerol lipase n=1 Tax=Pendulispora albinea TaxID=2741071 RepID=A0ABZ2LQQ9_9BACT
MSVTLLRSCARALSVLGLTTLLACSAGDAQAFGDSTEEALSGANSHYPIVLVHGMGGFDRLKNLPLDIVYFNGVKEDLAKRGETQVFTTIAPPYDTSEVRARYVADQIDKILAKTGAKKVNIIGHSQGGLDARVLASPNGLGYGDRIASITTVATPHRGSKVADLVLGLTDAVPDDVLDAVTGAVLKLLQISVYELKTDPHIRAQITELSEKYMTTVFNPKYKDDPRVRYSSYGGRTNLQVGLSACSGSTYPNDVFRVDAVPILLWPTTVYLQGFTVKANDGLVTVDSSKWGEFLQCVPADHLREVGQFLANGPDNLSKFDHLDFFRTIVSRLRESGY